MPQTQVVFFQDEDQSVPALDWLREMTRPASDALRDGIHELRVRFGNVNYRLLYGFHEENGQPTAAILVHGLTKERTVPPEDIDLAVRRRAAFAQDPSKHTYVRPVPPPRRQAR